MTMYMFCLSWSQSGPFLVHCNKIDTTNTNTRTRTTYHSEHLRSLSVLVGLVFCVVFCRSLFVSLFVFFGHWIVWFTLLISPSFAYTMIVIISLTIYPMEYHWLHIPWNIITTYPVEYHWLHIPWNIIDYISRGIWLTTYPVEYHWPHIPWNIIDYISRGISLTTYPVEYHCNKPSDYIFHRLKQWLLYSYLVKLKSSLRKFYGRHHDMVDRYEISVSQMATDMFHSS